MTKRYYDRRCLLLLLSGLALGVMACGDDAPSRKLPGAAAAQVSAIRAESKNGCRLDDDCAAGLHCFQNVCLTECSAAKPCANGEVCSARGRCLVSSGTPAALKAIRALQAPESIRLPQEAEEGLDEAALGAVASDLSEVEVDFWAPNESVAVRPGVTFIDVLLTTKSDVPGGELLYYVQGDEEDAPREASRAEGTRSFTLKVPTGSAAEGTARQVTIVTAVGSHSILLLPAPPMSGWYAGQFIPTTFGGAALPLEVGLELAPAEAISIAEAQSAWIWLPTSTDNLLSLAVGSGFKYVRRPLVKENNIWVAQFNETVLPSRYVDSEELYPNMWRAVRFEVTEEDGLIINGSLADRFNNLFDLRSADGTVTPETALVAGAYQLQRSSALPTLQNGELKEGSSTVPATINQLPPDVPSCTSEVWAGIVGLPAACPASFVGVSTIDLQNDEANWATCAIDLTDLVLSGGETIAAKLNKYLDPAVASTLPMSFDEFVQDCASETPRECVLKREVPCARELVAHVFAGATQSGAQVMADLSAAYDRTTSEVFIGRQLAAFYTDTQIRLRWLESGEAPAFLASTLKEYNVAILNEWRSEVLASHLNGVFGQIDASGLAVLSRAVDDPAANSTRKALLGELANSWRAAADALQVLAQRWNVILQDEASRRDAATEIRPQALRLYISAAMLQALNNATGSGALGISFGTAMSKLLAETAKLNMSFNALIFARDAEIVTSRSVDPRSDARSLLKDLQATAESAVADAEKMIDFVIDEAQKSRIDVTTLTAEFEDQLLGLRDELISLCGLPSGCTAQEMATAPECAAPVEAGYCGYALARGAAGKAPAMPEGSSTSSSTAGQKLLALREAGLAKQAAMAKTTELAQKASVLNATAMAFANAIKSWDAKRQTVNNEVTKLLGEIGTLNNAKVQAAVKAFEAKHKEREARYEQQVALVEKARTIGVEGAQRDVEKMGKILGLNIAATVLGRAADRVDAWAEVAVSGLPQEVGLSCDPSFAARLAIRTGTVGVGTGLYVASDALTIAAMAAENSRQAASILENAESAALEGLTDPEDIKAENEFADMEEAIRLGNIESEAKVSTLKALIEARRRSVEVELARSKDAQELEDRLDTWRMALIDAALAEANSWEAELSILQREQAYFQVVQSAQMLNARFASMSERWTDIRNLLGSADVLFSVSNRIARAESRLDTARRSMEEWLVALEYYSVRPFVAEHQAILLARNPGQLSAIATEFARLQKVCGGPVTEQIVEISVRDDLLGMSHAVGDAEGAMTEPGSRLRALFARKEAPGFKRVPYTTKLKVGELLAQDAAWAVSFPISIESFANLSKACNAKISSIAVQLVGDKIGSGLPVVSIAYDGVGQLRSCQPNIATYVKQFSEGSTAFGRVTPFKMGGRTVSPIARFNEYAPESSSNLTLEGLPLAAGYALIIDKSLPANQGVDWERLEDVKLRVRFNYQDVFPEGQCK